MVTDVTVIAQQESPWVRGLPAGLTHSALEAPPTFAENHFSDLEKKQPPTWFIRNLHNAHDGIHHVTEYGAYVPKSRKEAKLTFTEYQQWPNTEVDTFIYFEESPNWTE